MKNIAFFFQKPNFTLSVWISITVIASILKISLGTHLVEGNLVTSYNNYVIFKQSFFHLIEGKDLYCLYPTEHWDLYKYSPTFSVFFGFFAYLPDYFGAVLWNLLNSLVLFFAIKTLPIKNEKIKVFILWFVLLELLTSVQNSQSNGLIAGLIIFSFNAFEKKQIFIATLCIILSVYIKIFGAVAFLMFLFYPNKIKFIIYSIALTAFLAILPLIFVSFSQLVILYKSWLLLLSSDHSASYGLSVMGWLQTWFNATISKNVVLGMGVVLLCLPLIRVKLFKEFGFRLIFLASLLIWMIIFNHKAESPTFVIALSGIAIWFFSQKKNFLNIILVVFAFILASLSPTDIFPAFLRKNIVIPYVLKAVPCILIWAKIIYELMFNKFELKKELK
ncbi:MAG: DUF2029 domain-containing protein [Bacteroidetes bacterium]|nr:DUF2029 domain-containing protein [Bacteroidota bacterium]